MLTIKQYFSLQFVMLKRQLKDFGINPTIGIILVLVAFFILSISLFNKSEYAKYIYIFAALSIVLKNSETKRNVFLKITFPKKIYFTIRSLENLFVTLPFVFFLIVKRDFFLGFVLILFSALITLYNSKNILQITIPTPFFKRPFEFIIGYRKSIILILAAYFLSIMAVIYQNFNLGLASLILIFLICLTFYNDVENVFYVWIHKFTVNNFLLLKVKNSILFSTIISLPILLCLFIFFKNNFYKIIAIQLLGYLYIIAMILAKYAAFPRKMNLPEVVLLGLGLAMPPILIALIPFFYFQSHKRLKNILIC